MKECEFVFSIEKDNKWSPEKEVIEYQDGKTNKTNCIITFKQANLPCILDHGTARNKIVTPFGSCYFKIKLNDVENVTMKDPKHLIREASLEDLFSLAIPSNTCNSCNSVPSSLKNIIQCREDARNFFLHGQHFEKLRKKKYP